MKSCVRRKILAKYTNVIRQCQNEIESLSHRIYYHAHVLDGKSYPPLRTRKERLEYQQNKILLETQLQDVLEVKTHFEKEIERFKNERSINTRNL